MQIAPRSLVIFLACCMCGFVAWLAVGAKDGHTFAPTADLTGSQLSLTQELLTVPNVQALDGGQQVADQRLAEHVTPEAVAMRARSRTAYERMGAPAAARLARNELPDVVASAPSGLGKMPAGQRIARYLSTNAAQVVLPDGKRALAESIEPIAVPKSSGRYAPVDLSLSQSGSGFVAANPATAVRIPASLDAGVGLSSIGVSLTPVSQSGQPLQGEGRLDGATVLYANSQTDTDTDVKATTTGFETYDLLRSTKSPQELSYSVGMPEGAKLVPLKDGNGASQVIYAGRVVGMIPTPTAWDADGTPVPTSTEISGHVLHVGVAHRTGDYRYPIAVDPTVIDSDLLQGGSTGENWRFEHSGAHFTSGIEYATGNNHWWMTVDSTHELNEWGLWLYPTQGESHVYEVSAESSGSQPESKLEARLGIVNSGGWEASSVMPSSYFRTANTACVSIFTCSSSSGTSANAASFRVTATGTGTTASYNLYTASVYVAQTNGPSVTPNTTSPEFNSYHNVLYGSGKWMSPKDGYVGFVLSDPGVGIHETTYTGPEAKKWTRNGFCSGPVQCQQSFEQQLFYHETGSEHLPDGEPTLEVKAVNAMGSSGTTSVKIKVDATAPHEITLSGLPEGGQLGDANRALKLTAKATDGTGTTPSSGVASLKLLLDGQQIDITSGTCSPGPCTATTEWKINTELYGAGKHTLTVTATDKAGNVASYDTPITIHHAARTPIGPGTVNPISGELDLEESDVSIPTSGQPLTVTRSYSSRDPFAGMEGPLGSPWNISFGGAQKLEEMENGNVVLTAGDGGQSTFGYNGTIHYDSPVGDSGLALTRKSVEGGYSIFALTDKGATTTFTHVEADAENVRRPTISTSTGGTATTTYSYQVVGGIVEPLEALGPVPAGVSCASELKVGCRALTFNYATSTTATGEGSSEWGDYTGRLTRVYFTGYDTAAKTMTTTTVGQYAYDSKGRMRAEWDPRISPALKTTYGYDSEGRVTSLSSPGEEPWIFAYGTISSDTSGGRLVSLGRPAASTALEGAGKPSNTKTPSLSMATPLVGHPIEAYAGTWTNSPLRYGYQWVRCSIFAECATIAGAINRSYTPTAQDVNHLLYVRVTATNAGGLTTASSGFSNVCGMLAGEVTEYATVGLGTPWAITSGPDGNLWATMQNGGEIDKITTSGSVSQYPGVEVGSQPRGIAAGSDGNLWFTQYGLRKIGKMSTNGSLLASYEVEVNANNYGVTLGSDGNIWYASYLSNKVAKITTSGTYTAYGLPPGSKPYDVAAGPDKNLWFTNEGTNKIGKITTAGVITEYALPAGSLPREITAGPDGKLWFAEFGTNKIGKITTSGTVTEYALASGAGPEGIVAGPEGQMWFTELTAGKVGSITTSGTILTYSLPAGSQPKGIVVGPDGYLWIAEYGTKKIAKFSPGFAEGAHLEGTETPLPTSATSTIEYGVPVSGAGAPYTLSSAETSKWAQTDVPTEATAIFPPDEPMSWPATDYKRATIQYLDVADQVVNVASPNRGIATAEYNSYNDLVRALSPDNRAAALKEGAKSAEVAQTLDTQSTYGSEGTELLSTLGPRRTVKLANGTSVQARAHTVYSYDEGAPAGGPYRLVTKVTEGAQISGEPEADVRTTTTSYAGQNNLGWLLRKPTATRADPSGLKLTRTTIYDPASGNVTETRTPAAGAPGEEILSGYVYKTAFGNIGSGNGQFVKPGAITRDHEGNIWVADTENNRVEEFSSGGTFVRKFGTAGVENGQLKAPEGIAVDQAGRVWVADTGNNRIEQFSSTGTYVSKFGAVGTGWQQFKGPSAIVATPGEYGRLYVSDTGNSRIQEYTVFGEELGAFGSSGVGNGQLSKAEGMALDAAGDVWVADTGNNRVEEFSSAGVYMSKFGSVGSGNGQFSKPEGIAIDPEGNVFVADSGNGRVQELTSSGTYTLQFASVGTGEKNVKNPAGLVLDANANAYVLDTGNNRVQEWLPAGSVHESSGTGGTHGMQTIYYTAGTNSHVAACGLHPEWGGMPCETRPAAQPETSGIPDLPVTVATYDIWEDPLISTEMVGTDTRTMMNTYDAAGRVLTGTSSATISTALPTVKAEYSSETGALVKLSTTVESATRSVEGVFNKLGQMTSYSDAEGNTSTFGYDVDGRTESVNDGKGTQSYTYDATTGLLVKLVDSGAGTFTATYDAEGNMVTQGYPNGMNANSTYDAAGRETGVEYVKTTHCASGCTWYSDNIVPSIHGQSLSQTSTLSSQAYTYDAAGRLTKTQDTPAGSGCTTRVYSLDEETNITSLTTRAPGAGGVCATEGGTVENRGYDPANRLTDAGIAYDSFGDIKKLPAVDAGGTELLNTYYTDGTLATQSQGGQTIGYNLDPAGRPRQTISTGTINSTVTSHYSGDGAAPTWMEDTAGKWTRDIPGIGGDLVATQAGGEAAMLQIENLHGDIVGTASLSETATALLSTNDSTEYGVPRTSNPPKYSWLGGLQLSTELPSGVIAMGARSYVPRMGRFLQPDPVEGGSANAYAYTYGDPVNTSDPSGEFTVPTPSWVHEFFDEDAVNATEAAIERAAEEQATKEEAEAKAREALEEAWATTAGKGTGNHSGGSHKAAGGKIVPLSCNGLYCEKKGPLNIKCNASCHKQRKEERVKEERKKKRKEEAKEKFKEEVECGKVQSAYHAGEDFGVSDGLYHSGQAKRLDVVCDGTAGAPDLPYCEVGLCGEGGLEGYWGRDPRDELRWA